MVESSGVDYITVHGRRRSQRSSEPVNLEAIALVKSVAGVPIVANGDVFSLEDVERIVRVTRVSGCRTRPGGSEEIKCWAPFGSWLHAIAARVYGRWCTLTGDSLYHQQATDFNTK
ncbi:hypothetical protein C7212DRAFT_298508 [Tuber magnatum]|uniref:DUS-like FMN-binding domain-containing protein n=1 Tax=Tuber magnatum TaxID=42249 RepID=A0A317SNE7_9PEZI|nr:hypothetical protein C7212DRAFT_298508 [Tuber magnatum]